jgi:hypothetical protein
VQDQLLARVKKDRTRADVERYLNRLGDRLAQIRQTYRSRTVAADYTNPDTVEAYLLGYFPHYIATAYQAFSVLPRAKYTSYVRRKFKVTFVGGGPLPELIALCEWLKKCGIEHADIEVVLVDSHAEQWRNGVEFSHRVSRMLHPNINARIVFAGCDAKQLFNAATLEKVRGSDIVMFQNCLNEIVMGRDFDANCKALAESLRLQGALIVSDLNEYQANHRAVFKLRQTIATQLRIIREFEPVEKAPSPFSWTPPLLWYEFHGAKRVEGSDKFYFPPNRRPRIHLKSSVAAWEKLEHVSSA